MDNTFKVIIAGGRDFDNYEALKKVCSGVLHKKDNIEVVSGTAKGADELGERFAIDHNLGLKSFPAPWSETDNKPKNQIGTKEGRDYWKGAGHYRNKQMAAYADAAIIFHDGKSRGTANMITQMEILKKPFKIIKYVTK